MPELGDDRAARRRFLELSGARESGRAGEVGRWEGRLGRLRAPWEALLLLSVAAALFGAVLFGTSIIAWWPGSLPALLIGLGLVGASAGISSPLVPERAS